MAAQHDLASCPDAEGLEGVYYASPEPDRLPAELRALVNRGAPDEHTHLVVATFLGLVMKAHPERIASWFTELGDLEGSGAQRCIWPIG